MEGNPSKNNVSDVQYTSIVISYKEATFKISIVVFEWTNKMYRKQTYTSVQPMWMEEFNFIVSFFYGLQ